MKKTLLLASVAMLLMAEQGSAQTAARTTADTPADSRANSQADLRADARASALVAAMTREEKISLLHGTFGASVRRTRPGETRIGAGHVPGVPRIGIPELFESDASLGVANGGEMRPGDVATALPSGLSTAASFDPALAEAGGRIIGAEARAKGFNVLLAGGANLTRDPLNGRNFEYLSEDVLLTGVMAGAAIRGIQSNNIISTMKHFALNAQETGRNVLNARMDEAALRESDLLAFQIALERGQPGSVMCGYNQVNGSFACENGPLLNDALKRDWGFRGFVMSDWGAVHSTAGAANAGLDQESGQELDRQVYFAALDGAVAQGGVSAARLDDMARRVVRTMIAHGLIDRPTPASAQPIDYAAHGRIAQEAAEGGIVLLKNDGLLPLVRTAKRIVLIGGHADIGVLSGGGSSQVRAVSGTPLSLPLPNGGPLSGFIKITYHGSSPLKALQRALPGAQISFVDGTDPVAAAAAARGADVAIVFGEQWRTEAIDVPSLDLDGVQNQVIDAVAAANPRTVVVLETGGAVAMPWRDRVGAIVEAWYPGDRGGEAIARVLTGAVNPSGRLPLTFPASMAQAPRPTIPGLAAVQAAAAARANQPPRTDITTVDLTGGVATFDVDYPEGADAGYRWYARQGAVPLYPFGYGLSYTSFGYGGLKITGGARPVVAFTVRNTGKRAGAEVAQVYAALPGGTARLVGFQRVTLQPGQSRQVSVTLDPRLLARFDTAARRWELPAATASVTVGRHAGDAVLSGQAAMPAQVVRP
jgi:beta-glucosidase